MGGGGVGDIVNADGGDSSGLCVSVQPLKLSGSHLGSLRRFTPDQSEVTRRRLRLEGWVTAQQLRRAWATQTRIEAAEVPKCRFFAPTPLDPALFIVRQKLSGVAGTGRAWCLDAWTPI